VESVVASSVDGFGTNTKTKNVAAGPNSPIPDMSLRTRATPTPRLIMWSASSPARGVTTEGAK
jgi:hypothetical protein